MDGFSIEVIERLPLAESVTLLFRSIANEKLLAEIWEDHRGRCYEKVISFPLMVHLISDELLTSKSGRQSFRKNKELGILNASLVAAYEKLARIPIAVNQQFLERATGVLRDAFPEWSTWKRPVSLQNFRILYYDGKAVKRVAHRLKETRGVKGGLLGGRALVVQDWETGMAIAMHGDPDGQANEIKHLGQLVTHVRQILSEPRLQVGDRAFCDLVQPRSFQESPGDHFLVRYHPKVTFHQDETVVERCGVTSTGAMFKESWGWLGSEKDACRLYVRRIELLRPNDESVVLITSLLDAAAYPAQDLLFIYRHRWGIEQIFQQITQVFGLSQLIGTTPKATLFQFAFCLLLFNMIQVIRGYVAQDRNCDPSEISTELLFHDVEEELIAWNKLLTPEQTQEYFDSAPTIAQLKRRLTALLKKRWSETWRSTPTQLVHNSVRTKRQKTHSSVHRLLFGTTAKKKRKNLAQRIKTNPSKPQPKRP